MQSITLTPEERKDLTCTMKREGKPSRRLWMHIVLFTTNGHRPTRIAHVLYCSRTTVYTRIERLVEEDLRAQHGRLRSRWSCKLLAVELSKERALVVGPETVRRMLHKL